MRQQPLVTFNDGVKIPQLGLGVWQVSNDEVTDVALKAFEIGYRHIDTAAGYENEEGVGEAIRRSGLAREEIFVTSKLRNGEHGYDSALRAFDASMERLGLDVLDLYLIHWPMPKADKYVDTWKAFVRLKEDGRIRSIGVSNFNPDHIERIVAETGVTPAANQIELHPYFQRRDMRAFHNEKGIAIESWSPLGVGRVLEDETIVAVAEKHGKTPGQVVIRWHLQQGLVLFPKSSNPDRLRENFDVFDFDLDAGDIDAINTLDKGAQGRMGGDPLVFP